MTGRRNAGMPVQRGHSVELSKIQPVTPRRQDMGLRDAFAHFIHNDVHNNRG